MTWPFENDTSDIEKKLAKKSLQSEKRRNLMVVIAVALAAFLICFTGIVSTSLTQMQRNQVVDTYEAVWLGVEENDIETLKGLPEFERVGGYYMLGEELSEQGYHASYVYCDAQMMEITKAQMELLEGRVPEKANEVVVSEYFLSTYGNNAKIGDTVTLDTESFHGDYVVTGIMDSVNEKEANTCAIILSKAALTEWDGFDPAGYRAYVHFKNSDQLGEELMTSYCREIAEEYQLPIGNYQAEYWNYTEEGYLMFSGVWFSEELYVLTLSGAEEHTALRVQPLDETYRELSRKYLRPISFERNNMFIVDWSENDFGDLNFYDMYDILYPKVNGQYVPYVADDNLSVSAVYQIPKEEFESIIMKYFNIDSETLQSKTVYDSVDSTYEYKPRGFEEVEYPEYPYSEVVGFTENSDGTITLTANVVFPYAGDSKVYAHEVVVRPLEDGGVQYVSNRIIPSEDNYRETWHTPRLTLEEWEELYGGE